MSWFIPNIIEAWNLTYSHRIRYGFMITLWIGVSVLSLYTGEIIVKSLVEGKNVFNPIYMSFIIGEIIISKVISYGLMKKFGYDFWGKLNPMKYKEYLCANCLNHINEDDNKDIFTQAVKRYGWKNIIFIDSNYSYIQIQYLLDILLDNTYSDKTMKAIVEEYIVPLLPKYENKKDIINLILQHVHLSIKRIDKDDNLEIYLILYIMCMKNQLADTLSIIECNLYNFINTLSRRQKLAFYLSLPKYNIKSLLPKVDTILKINKKQEIQSNSTEDIPSMEDAL